VRVRGAALALAVGCGASPAPDRPHLDVGDGARVRFLALGDGGTGGADQARVAAVAAAVCAAKADADGPGCDFALLLGDLIYPSGATGPDDPAWQTHVEGPLAPIGIPVYAVLGNHDYGPTGMSTAVADAAVAYAVTSERLRLPARAYSFTAGPALFTALDTQAAFLSPLIGEGGQAAWAAALPDAHPRPWRVAFGHHPLRSDGRHGDAGAYEGLPWLPLGDGEAVRALGDDALCGRYDLYLSGHDHNLQWLEPECGLHLIVSGAAGKTTPLQRARPRRFAADHTPGFFWLELTAERMRAEAHGAGGELLYAGEAARVR
jgi:hypothetical protein